MNEGEGASPQEQLAAEVAADTSETGEVTANDVADVLHLPKSGDNGNGAEENAEEGEDDDTSDDDAADSADDAGDDSGDDAEEVEEEDAEELADDEEAPQFALKVTDATGKEYTIGPDDDIEKILEDFEPKSNGQIFSILKELGKLESAKAEYEAQQEEQANQDAYQQQVNEIRTGWDKEIEALQGDKRIPVSSDGKVPARVTEVFKFISAENEKRVQEGRPLLTSFEDALDKLELRETKDEAIKKDKQEKELARQRGSKVGGWSAPASSGISPYRRGARTATEALKQMGVLR